MHLHQPLLQGSHQQQLVTTAPPTQSKNASLVVLRTIMKMSICFLIVLFGVAAADKPGSRYGEPEPVEKYKPQAYHPVV